MLDLATLHAAICRMNDRRLLTVHLSPREEYVPVYPAQSLPKRIEAGMTVYGLPVVLDERIDIGGFELVRQHGP